MQQPPSVPHGLRWRKASHSAEGNDACVEIARTTHRTLVRDSKHPNGDVLAFTPAVWASFLDRVKRGGNG
jgi:hypothetical protein